MIPADRNAILSTGKSTLTDSLVAAAGIIAMENVSCRLESARSWAVLVMPVQRWCCV